MKIRLVSVSKNISAVFYYTRRISAVKRPPLFLPKFRTRIGERIDTENFSVRIAFSFHVRYNKTNILSWAGMGFLPISAFLGLNRPVFRQWKGLSLCTIC